MDTIMIQDTTRIQGKLQEKIDCYSDMLFKIAYARMGNRADAEDIVQETFYQYLKSSKDFGDEEYEKAWLIKVAANRCRDIRRGRSRHPEVQYTDVEEYCEFQGQSEVLAELMNLPDKLKEVVYLHYIEGYRTAEIAQMLGITPNAVKKRLQRGRESLRVSLYGERKAGAG